MKKLTLPQGTIHYTDEGTGPTVLFVHGLLVDGELWRGVAGPLARTHRCIVPTWPLGSHRSPMNADADLSPAGVAALVADFMAALDLRDVTLVGNDSGGAVSQLVAARHPERIGRLVLTNCDALEVFPPKGFEYLAWLPRVPGAMFLMSRAMLHLPFLRRLKLAYGALSQRPISDAQLRSWVSPSARSAGVRRDTAKFMRGATPAVTLGAAEGLRSFRRPALLLWADDKYFPLSLAHRLAEHLPDCKVAPVRDARTFVPMDQPGVVADAIARFAA